MTTAEIIALISSLSAIIVAGIKFILDRVKRRDYVSEKKHTVQKSLDEFKQETTIQFIKIDNRFETMEEKVQNINSDVGVIVKFNRAQAYDKIRLLGLQAIKRNFIAEDELQTLITIYQAYKNMHTNEDQMKTDEFLDKVMAEVYNLRIKPTNIETKTE